MRCSLPTKVRLTRTLALALLLASGCDGDGSAAKAPAQHGPTKGRIGTNSNRSDIATELRTAKAAPHSESDGTGRAWIEAGPAKVTAGTAGSWTFVYEAGDSGVAQQGRIIFMVSPFWGWSAPQDQLASAPGYTTVRTDAPGITLHAETSGSPMMGISLAGRGLRASERVIIEYGGATGARVDRFAEARSRFWIGVDGDGDGTHRFLEDSPAVEIDAAQPVRLVVSAPTTVAPGADFPLRIAFLDRNANAGTSFTGSVRLGSEPLGIQSVSDIEIGPTDHGRAKIALRAPAEGVYRVRATTADGADAVSNPIVVTPPGAPRIFWGDLHGHSALSDGTGSLEDYFLFARDVAGLDVVALTDHDHWGVLHLDEHPSMWSAIQEQTKAFHVPGSFVTLLGYEWTSWEYGHRHVLYFTDRGDLLSSIDLDYSDPDELWKALRGRDVITVAHHSAGGPIATDWSFVPDPVLEPVTEVVSVHGVSEAPDTPSTIYDPVPGNFVRDVLDRGVRFGFIGSGDSHDGHPGLAQLANGGTGGLAAIIARDLTRPAILEALRARRVYATSGPRIYLRTALSTFPMGSAVRRTQLETVDGAASLYVHAIGTGEIAWLDLVRSGKVTRSAVDASELEVLLPIEDPRAGEYLYVRIIQSDGGMAWSSPIYIE